MNFIEVESLGISLTLDVLNRDTQRYSIFLYQHNGEFYASNSRIGNVDQSGASNKYQMLLKKAFNENISLLLSPEYSCPKTIVDSIISKKIQQPKDNKIWVLGGESINKSEINDLMSKNSNEILIHSENVYESSDKKFLNPLYYIFKGRHKDDEKLIILIQFKTKHMGIWSGGDIEADNLIEGESIYILKNSNTSTRLVSFVCSEAMNVSQKLSQDVKDSLDWSDKPFLVLNPQINPDPSHLEFIKFRNFILEDDKKELISLNWGKKTYINGNSWFKKEADTPRSGIFFKTDYTELDYSNAKIISNHEKGLYFLYQNRNKFVYLIDGFSELIKIENKPVHINQGTPQQKRREGPEAIYNYKFDLGMNDFQKVPDIFDSHISFFEERGIEIDYLLSEESSIVDKERLINMSTGQVSGKHGGKWHEIIHLNSFELKESNECNCRLTYVEDSYQTSEDVRSKVCNNLIELDQTILQDKSIYPKSIQSLTNQSVNLAYSEDAKLSNYKFNLSDDNGKKLKATVCYLGNVSKYEINKTYDEIQKLFDEDSEEKRRVVVFYKTGTSIKSKFDETEGSITHPPKDNGSII